MQSIDTRLSVFTPTVIRELTHKKYDHRKEAALEVESLVKASKDHPDQVTRIIDELVKDFVYSRHDSNAQCGGLISLAATAIALGSDVAPYLDTVVPPIVESMGRKKSSVRYYACECMYNVAKVSKGELLRFFNSVFEAQCKLSTNKEPSIKNGRDILDRLIKEIAFELAGTYTTSHGIPQGTPVKAFSVQSFIPVLRRRIYSHHPAERLYVMSWIGLLDSIPEFNLVWYLPEYMDGLIRVLGDANQPVRANARLLLARFFQQIQTMVHQQHSDEGVALSRQQKDGEQQQRPPRWGKEQDARMIEILVPHLTSPKEDIQRTALQWIIEFITIAKDVVLQFTPRIIIAVLPSLEHPVPTISAFAIETNRNLQKLVMENKSPEPVSSKSDPSSSLDDHLPNQHKKDTNHGSMLIPSLRRTHRSDIGHQLTRRSELAPGDMFDYQLTVINLRLQFHSDHTLTRIESLRWLKLLHTKAREKISSTMDGTFPMLLKLLSDSSEEVVFLTLELIALVAEQGGAEEFDKFTKDLLSLFAIDGDLLETRGDLIISELCMHLGPEQVFCTMARILEQDKDLDFANMMVQNLNIILITSEELSDIRKQLRALDTKEGRHLFLTLYRSWCHNAISAFSLALMAEAYDHAANMLQFFADIEMTVTMLIQLDQLVQLLESPVFTYLRLQLLEPSKYPQLLKCLYGIFMLLPQSASLSPLRSRLNSASSLGFMHAMPKNNTSLVTSRSLSMNGTTTSYPSSRKELDIDFQDLMRHLETLQFKHEAYRNQCKEQQETNNDIT
ncbi:ARM repeat-containing protein [Lichtheimia hyalospora FSU 10163]|nr:ARM repeat-containing protein [Lichtheimia hyalospora FSU 10163]